MLLRNALYGLRQSPQLFNKLLHSLLTESGLVRCAHEACIYKYFDVNRWMLIAAEDDDLIVTGTNEAKIAELCVKSKLPLGRAPLISGRLCPVGRARGASFIQD